MFTRSISRSASPVEHTVVLNELGSLSGEVWATEENGSIVRFLNVPYASPPVRELR